MHFIISSIKKIVTNKMFSSFSFGMKMHRARASTRRALGFAPRALPPTIISVRCAAVANSAPSAPPSAPSTAPTGTPRTGWGARCAPAKGQVRNY